jgi:integral membrane protein
MPDLQTPVGRVRLLGRIEGVSFLLLVGIAMPLKYFANQPLAVKYVGWAHGLLFIVLCMAIFQAWAGGALSLKRSALAFIAALVPFGPFIIDSRLAEDEAPGDEA